MSENPFIKPIDFYTRKVDPIGQYIHQASQFISTTKNIPFQKAKEFVLKCIKEKQISKVRDPIVTHTFRQDNGDKIKVETPLTEYLRDSLSNKEIIAPTLTTYINPEVKESILVKFVETNVAERSKAKKAGFAAKARGDKLGAILFDRIQSNKKIANNSLSGAAVSKSTPLCNKSSHSTLTSICRNTSALGNANNEKLLSGNRHYWSPNIVMNNIASIVSNTDYKELQEVMDKYNFYYPTDEDVMACIKYSTDFYWRDANKLQDIYDYVKTLKPIERASFVYTGDLYHLAKHNEEFVKQFVGILSTKINGSIEDPIKIIHKLPESHVNLAHQICLKEMAGMGKRYDELSLEDLSTLVLTTKHITDHLNNHKDLISALWLSRNIPASVAYLPSSIRRAALTSDTDSTIFTVQEWIKWYFGNYNFTDESRALSASMIFIAAESITHVLAIMSANMGVKKSRLNQVAMKNEFAFDVFVPTDVSKHYWAYIGCQEGNVFKDYEMEIKGVHLKSSNAPKKITAKAQEMMKFVNDCVVSNKPINLTNFLKEIAKVENEIKESILSGNLEYFRLGQIKPAASYTLDQRRSAYGYYLFWQEVFAEKYGECPEPAVTTIKLNTTLENPTITKEWLAGIEDEDIRNKMQKWLTLTGKKNLPTVMLPAEIVARKGLPIEFVSAINIRKIITDLCGIFYLILTVFGYYKKEDELISDRY